MSMNLKEFTERQMASEAARPLLKECAEAMKRLDHPTLSPAEVIERDVMVFGWQLADLCDVAGTEAGRDLLRPHMNELAAMRNRMDFLVSALAVGEPQREAAE